MSSELSANTSENPSTTDNEYNRVFEKFVGDEGSSMSDIVGIVAYGIYKNAKREWATEFRRNFGRAPTQEDLRAYHATWTPAQIQSGRNSAAQVMTAYADSVISAEEPRILRDALKGTFWPAVGTSIAANAIYTISLIIVGIILARAGVDLLGIVSSAAGK